MRLTSIARHDRFPSLDNWHYICDCGAIARHVILRHD
jgi:hypothetical protein